MAVNRAAAPKPTAEIDSRYLQTLLGYNARRVSLMVFELFTKRMAAYGLSPVDFSVLSLIRHNPGITSRQLCTALGLLPPNLVNKITLMENSNLLSRQPHPDDGRAIGLYLTNDGNQLMAKAEVTATLLENEASKKLSPTEAKTLLRLLKKLYV